MEGKVPDAGNDRQMVIDILEQALNSKLTMLDLEFLGALQTAHDESCRPDIMQENLAGFARLHNLTVPE
jgi:hypothetical protein